MHTIYCFNNGGTPNWYEALAIADDGHVLASHICSSEDWMAHDLGITSNWKHDKYDAHFGAGEWELVWVNDPVNDERVKAAMELNAKLAEDAKQQEVATRTHVTITYE